MFILLLWLAVIDIAYHMFCIYISILILEEDALTSQSCLEMTDVSATPSILVHCEEVKAVTWWGWPDDRRLKVMVGILGPQSQFGDGWCHLMNPVCDSRDLFMVNRATKSVWKVCHFKARLRGKNIFIYESGVQ